MLKGLVIDDYYGSPLPGAVLQLQTVLGGLVQLGVSNRYGEYVIDLPDTVNYVWVTAAGHAKKRIETGELQADPVIRLTSTVAQGESAIGVTSPLYGSGFVRNLNFSSALINRGVDIALPSSLSPEERERQKEVMRAAEAARKIRHEGQAEYYQEAEIALGAAGKKATNYIGEYAVAYEILKLHPNLPQVVFDTLFNQIMEARNAYVAAAYASPLKDYDWSDLLSFIKQKVAGYEIQENLESRPESDTGTVVPIPGQTTTYTLTQTAAPAASGVPSWVWLAGGAAVLLVLRKKKQKAVGKVDVESLLVPGAIVVAGYFLLSPVLESLGLKKSKEETAVDNDRDEAIEEAAGNSGAPSYTNAQLSGFADALYDSMRYSAFDDDYGQVEAILKSFRNQADLFVTMQYFGRREECYFGVICYGEDTLQQMVQRNLSAERIARVNQYYQSMGINYRF